MASSKPLGLREKQKQAVRGELSLAALRLARDRGIDAVRTEDIVAAAGVSRRTFSNYFANKYEAIADRLVERTQNAAEALLTRPQGEPLWEALSAALIAPYESAFGEVPASTRKKTLRLLEDPALLAEILKGDLVAQQTLTAAIAQRTGTSSSDFYPALVAATATAAITTALNRWLRSEKPQPLAPLIREALQQIEQGLPEPRKGKR